ncbi:uncharacterized protein J8A68_002505 [[Candida] subhashii]|uniref:Uncharacterized protein n=1 Tax=[Candida] subhashii TaxID=561895 RepID=A0A8J5QCZ2_9ASCO|nr:uncharacterized protein J8A68_002505 [[Candida] subhashii]KAG7663944.1 hypothetical protein J8A68_002505 [[Candida] subhashii]
MGLTNEANIISPQHSIEPPNIIRISRNFTESNIYLNEDEISPDEEDSDPTELDTQEPQAFVPSSAPISRQLTRTDATSFVGGKSIETVYRNQIEHSNAPHPIADSHKTSSQQEFKANDTTFQESELSKFSDSQKVFSFSLPFGGLLNLRSHISRQIQNFKIIDNFVSRHDDELTEQVRLKLEKQQSISTVDEAKYFKGVKGTDDGRFRAVKSTFTSNLNEILPDFKSKKEEKEPCDTIYDRIEGNIVILGGYRGSILRDTKSKKRVWIPIKAGFNLRKIDLLLGPTKQDELNAEDSIYPDGMLKNIGPIDMCKKFIKKLEANPKVNIREFGYDWRLSGDYTSKKLEQFLTDIYNETGKPVLVIAHSMGGMIAQATLQRNPKLFRSIVYVGCPSECLNILGPIRFGDSILLSDKILTFETNFMMRSSFVFLPLSGRVFYNKEAKEYYDLDYFDPDTWVEYNLNPLVSKNRKIAEESSAREMLHSPSNDSILSFPSINSISNKINKLYRSKTITLMKSKSMDTSSHSLPGVLNGPATTEDGFDDNTKYSFTFKEAYNYLKETLESTKKFILSLEYNPDLEDQYPPMAVVYGNTIPSVRGSIVRSRQDIKDGNYYEFFYGHGDGVVHQRWLMPEKKGFSYFDADTCEGQIVGKFASMAGHVNLMTDFKAMGMALNAVVEAEGFWKEKELRKKKMKMARGSA